jgi:Icc protein
MSKETVYFVHLSDTHIGPTPGYARFGQVSLPSAQRLVNIINSLPVTPDFVIHTGDVVTDPDPDSYALAAETFATLEPPIYYVTGNHDSSSDIHRFLPMGPKVDVTTDRSVLSYTFEIKGYRFLVLDAHGSSEIDPHGLLSRDQIDLVRQEASSDGPPLTVFVHFPALPLNSTWMDENVLILNGLEFHEALLPARARLRGVFLGHIHQHTQVMRDGILYVSVASTFHQFSAWPGAEVTGFDPEHPPAYNFIHLLPEQTIIHQHAFPRL